ncbi:MAG: ABC-F family ATP-binding cassette domain-containing protein [Leptospiraceae bacterium]|nr:ABC-F family ATP-binding cassette domain-containing protein [Leptospiraceae bacterium]
MQLLSVSKLSKMIGDKFLFKDLDFGIEEEDKIAIVGTNGSGKSTLLKIILGKEESDSGEIVRNRTLKVSYLNQNPSFNPEDTIRDHLYSNPSQLTRLILDYTLICEKLSNGDSIVDEEYSRIQSEMERLELWDYESKIASILKELGVPNLDLKIKNLSDGMQKKVELARTLIEESNLLILDEPTNHLDISSIIWLESYLETFSKALLLITHDRYFLDRITNRILEIDSGKTFFYLGNYSYYLEKKVEREETLLKEEHKKERLHKQEMEWLKRQPKARTTKQKARIDRAIELDTREKFRLKEELELVVANKRQGKTVMELKSVSKKFEERSLINNFSYYFKKAERLGIVGGNGVGKSTLLNLISARMNPDSGQVIPGINTKIGYFDQRGATLVDEMTVIQYIKKYSGEYILNEDGEKITASKMLEKFLFDGRMQNTEIGKLSGGEKRRLSLVQILMTGPNFLILDEPTNDLDIKTLTVLENFLLSFPGTVVIVAHDRYFLDRVAETLLVFKDGTIETYVGTYSDYLEKFPLNKVEPKPKKVEAKEKEPKTNTKQKKEIAKLELEISELESKKLSLEKELHETEDYKRIAAISEEIESINKSLEEKVAKWELAFE